MLVRTGPSNDAVRIYGTRWAVRKRDWKLIGNPRDPVNPDSLGRNDALFLVNLAEDPAEQTNRANKHPERVKELKTLHDTWYVAIP